MREGPREKLLYVVTVQPNLEEIHGDYCKKESVKIKIPYYQNILSQYQLLTWIRQVQRIVK